MEDVNSTSYIFHGWWLNTWIVNLATISNVDHSVNRHNWQGGADPITTQLGCTTAVLQYPSKLISIKSTDVIWTPLGPWFNCALYRKSPYAGVHVSQTSLIYLAREDGCCLYCIWVSTRQKLTVLFYIKRGKCLEALGWFPRRSHTWLTTNNIINIKILQYGICGGVCCLAVNTLNSGSGGLGFKPGLSHCFLFFCSQLYF